MVTKSDLARIRTQTIIKTKEERIEERKMENEQKMQRMAVAMARKQRMQQRDWERAENAPLEVKASTFGENTLLSKAQAQMDEQDDDVKFTNQMVMASKVYTIRDKQLAENKCLEDDFMAEQKRLDMMMEVERLKAIKAEMEREERAALARKRGAQVIIDQIASREEIRQKEAEALEQEKAQLLFNIEKNKKEDAEAAAQRKERYRIMNEEIQIANKKQKEQKIAAKDAERQLDDKIAEH